MRAVFICGGIGKRMFPMTDDKFFLSYLGKPLLIHQMEMAIAAGINDFVIIGNPKNIDEIAGITSNVPDIKVNLVVQKKALGIANALECAVDYLDGEILIVNPNDVIESSAYSNIITAYKNGGADSYLLGYQVQDYFPGGYMVVNGENELLEIIEKPDIGKEPSNLVNILVHLHTNGNILFKYFNKVKTSKDCVYEMALDLMIKGDYKIQVASYNDFWTAIKYPWHILTVMDNFLNQCKRKISSTAKISDRAIIDGDVVIDDEVTIMENAVVRGPCFIGRNTIIGNNVLIRNGCHIGKNCVIGHCSEVKHSYIDDDCWFHSNYIGDSIIGKRCSLGAGTITANLRFDNSNTFINVQNETVDTNYSKFGAIMGNGCKTGINVSIMPGIRLGVNSIVGPHVNLTHDLDPDKMIVAETRYRVINKDLFRKS